LWLSFLMGIWILTKNTQPWKEAFLMIELRISATRQRGYFGGWKWRCPVSELQPYLIHCLKSLPLSLCQNPENASEGGRGRDWHILVPTDDCIYYICPQFQIYFPLH
jgi:hypothetical protein